MRYVVAGTVEFSPFRIVEDAQLCAFPDGFASVVEFEPGILFTLPYKAAGLVVE